MSFSQINTNVQSMRAFTSLQNTSSELGMRRQRLSTGLRINSAEDDSAGYAIANKLEAKTRGQGQALRNIGDAKGMLTVAEGSLNSSMDILQTMKEKAVQASNDSLGASERDVIQSQLNELASEIGDTLGNADFNGTSLFGGSETLDDGSTGQQLNFQVGAGSSDTFQVGIEALSESKLGTTTGGSATLAGTDSDAVENAAFGGDSDVAAFDLKIEANDSSGFKVTQDQDGDGTFDAVSGAGDVSDGDTVTFGDFSFDIKGTPSASSFTIAGDADGGTESNVDVSSLDVTTDADSRASAIDTIDAAIQNVSDEMASLGDGQSRLSFKEDNLETAKTNYEASKSRIEDADFAQEQMEISKLQILQQTGTASLAQANASSQSVLSLLG